MSSPDTPLAPRSRSYLEGKKPSLLDRLGNFLSARRIRRAVGDLSGKRLGDFGCGYEAHFVRSCLPRLAEAVIVDVSISPSLKNAAALRVIEGRLPECVASLPSASLDVALCISVLEHLTEPERMLEEMRRLLAPGGVAVVNVPSWRGKRFLEFSAFRLGLSPREEMDDHKRYYDPRDLWPMLVAAGFWPHAISCRRHKFGMNTLAVCRVDADR